MSKQVSSRWLWQAFAASFVTMFIVFIIDCRPSCAQSFNPDTETSSATADSATEEWEAFYVRGAKVGYGRFTVRAVDCDGTPLVESHSEHHVWHQQLGKPTSQRIESRSLETPAGKLLEFFTKVASGASSVKFSGHVDGDAMVIETVRDGATHESRIPWSDDIRGIHGVEQSLAEKPLQPHEKRQLRVLVPIVNEAADIALTAADYEETQVLTEQQRLLRIEGESRLPAGNVVTETIWTDQHGKVIKRRIEASGQESFRTTAEVAKADAPAAKPQLDVDGKPPVKSAGSGSKPIR